MAINLAGAVGMTGKRESILSDLAPIIKNTGDSITKSIQENNQRKALAAKKAAEEKQDFLNDLSKDINVNINADSERQKEYQDRAAQAINEVYEASKKGVSQGQLGKIKADVTARLGAYKWHLENEYGTINEIRKTDRAKYDLSQYEEAIAGKKATDYTAVDFNAEDKTQQGTVNPDGSFTSPYPITVPQESEMPKRKYMEMETPYLQKPLEERMKQAPSGMSVAFGHLIKLEKGDAESALDVVLGGKDFEKRWTSEKKTELPNGIIKYDKSINPAQIAEDKSTFIGNVVSGNEPDIIRFRNTLTDAALKAANAAGIVDAKEREDFVNESIKKGASLKYDEIVKTQISKFNEKQREDLKPDKQSGGSAFIINNNGGVTDSKTKQVIDPIVEGDKTIGFVFSAQANKDDTPLEGFKVIGKDGKLTYTYPMKPTTVDFKNNQIKGITLVDEMAKDETGTLMPTGKKISKEITVPLTENWQYLAQNKPVIAEMARQMPEIGGLVKRYDDLNKKSKQNVSSQGKKEGVKEPKKAETKTTKTPTKTLGSGRIVYLQADGTYGINDPNKK